MNKYALNGITMRYGLFTNLYHSTSSICTNKNGFILCNLDKLSKNALLVLTMWTCCGTMETKNALTGGKCEKMTFEKLQTGEKVRRFCAYYIIKRGNVYYAYDNYEWMLEDERESKEKMFFNRLAYGQFALACRKLSALIAELEKIEGIKQQTTAGGQLTISAKNKSHGGRKNENSMH